ncbi:MAG: YceD family protein [Wenzhouxiangellaceae bacterium]|nr:YceD family protein [Wenzhouxiangellaceae bacterium]
MSRDYPDWIDADRAARGNRRFRGTMRLDRMPRIVDLLESPEADDEIGFEIDAWRDEQGHARLDVRLEGEVPLRCQRTLERYLQPVASSTRLAVVSSERQAEGLPEDVEPKLAEDGRLELEDVVADELLLSLPLVPVRPDTERVVGAGDRFEEPEEEPGPFAELARMKSDRSKD